MACPHTANFVYLTQAVRDMISAEKKPQLYERVRADKDDSEMVGKMKDALMIPVGSYKRLSEEQARKIVDLSFKMIYDDRFLIGIEHLQEQY